MASAKPYQLIILPEATEEIVDLFDFYEASSTGLGDRFMDKLGDCLNAIEENPSRFQYALTKKERIRRGICTNPSVIVLYWVVKKEIQVLAVRDARSNWLNSLNS
jgi:plasmid stabilization system protein ParE